MACAQISKDCGFKCGKCRTVIIIDNNEQIILLDTDNRESLKQKLPDKSDGLWHLQTDSLPDWVTESINQSSWTKGKLHCPSCQTKVGSFDFVGDNSQISPVHLVKSKVDLYGQLLPGENKLNNVNITSNDETAPQYTKSETSLENSEITSSADLATGSTSIENEDLCRTVSSLICHVPKISSPSPERSSSEDGSESESGSNISVSSESSNVSSSQGASSNSSGSEASNMDPPSVLLDQYRGSPTSVSSSTSLEDGEDLSIESIEGSSSLEADIVEIDFVLGSRGDMRVLSRAKKRRLRVNRQSGRHKMKTSRKHKKEETQQIMEQKIIKEILEAEPELDALDPTLICPVLFRSTTRAIFCHSMQTYIL